MRTSLTALACSLLMTWPLGATPGDAWLADFDAAARIAREQKKDLLVDFTGSDWCGWCIRLDREVFDKEAFLEVIQRDYVLVKLDFPNGEAAKAAVPDPVRNQELADTYGIPGFPAILLMTPDGEVFGRTGYQAGGPEKYLEHLTDLETKGRVALEQVRVLLSALEEAQGEALAAVYTKAIDALAGMEDTTPGADRLAAAVKGAIAFDDDGSLGLKLRAVKALLVSGHADSDILATARTLDQRNAEGLLEQVVLAQVQAVDTEEAVRAAYDEAVALDALGPLHDPETALWIYANVADWSHRILDESATAKRFAAKAKALAEADPRHEQMVPFLEEIIRG